MNHVARADFDRYMTPNYAPAPIVPVRGRGSRLWDRDDREYVDFAGGIAVSALGHAHPALVAALTAEMRAMFGDEPHASPDLGRIVHQIVPVRLVK